MHKSDLLFITYEYWTGIASNGLYGLQRLSENSSHFGIKRIRTPPISRLRVERLSKAEGLSKSKEGIHWPC